MAPRIPHVVLSKLKEIDPEATFEGTLPRIQSSSGAVYFVKVGSPSEAAQYEGEAQSLQAINKAAPDIAPRVLKTGVSDTEDPYFIKIQSVSHPKLQRSSPSGWPRSCILQVMPIPLGLVFQYQRIAGLRSWRMACLNDGTNVTPL